MPSNAWSRFARTFAALEALNGGDEAQDLPARQWTRITRLQELITQKESEVEDLKERISQDEAAIAELGGVADAEPAGHPPPKRGSRICTGRSAISRSPRVPARMSRTSSSGSVESQRKLRTGSAASKRREAQEARRTRGDAPRHGRKIFALTNQRNSSVQLLESASSSGSTSWR